MSTKKSKKPNNKEIAVYYNPYPKQTEVHNCKKKYRVVCNGRRTGKTMLASAEVLSRFSESSRPLNIGWIAPTYNIAERGLDVFKQVARDLISEGVISVVNSTPAVARMGDHKCYWLSADNPTSLRGFYFDFIIIDEAHYVEDAAFNDAILPLALDTDAPILAISTPRGKYGWFYERAISEADDTQFFNWTTYDNPYIADHTIESVKQTMPLATFQQEILGLFIEADSQVFSDVSHCFDTHKCTCDVPAVMSADLARKVDDTCFMTICPRCRRIRDMEILSSVPWSEQIAKIKGFYARKNANVLKIDGTGIGDVVVGELQQSDINLEPIIFSAPTKLKLYTDLISQIEKAGIHWDNKKFPEVATQLLDLQREIKKTTVAYNACTGKKDDVCDALALGLDGIDKYRDLHIYSLSGSSVNPSKKKDHVPFSEVRDTFVDDKTDGLWD